MPRPLRLLEQYGYWLIFSASIGLMTASRDDVRRAGSREVFRSKLYPPDGSLID